MSSPGATPAPSAPPRGPLGRVRAWTGRSEVQRVELYTVGTLYVLYWFLVLLWALGAAAEAGTTTYGVGLLAGLLVLGGVGMVVLRGTLRHRIEGGPVPRAATVVLVVLSALGAAAVLLLPDDARSGASFLVVGTLGWCAGGLPDRRWQWFLAVVSFAVPWLVTGSALVGLGGLAIGVFFASTVQSSLWLLGIVTELDRARGTQAALAVAEERLRFSRDVHDVLGRRLSTIAVQAELAATLSSRGDARAADRILEVRETAHEGLREARELARGYRPLDLAHELDGAVSLLRSAGIATDVAVAGLPDPWHEPAARTIREGVTNVLRHSDASRVAIRFAGGELVVENDGVPTAPTGSGDGTGLAALREHLAPLGAALEVRRAGDRFALVATLPGAQPTGRAERAERQEGTS